MKPVDRSPVTPGRSSASIGSERVGEARMTDAGGFCWYELTTHDLDRAQRFYTHIFGWDCASFGIPGTDYRLFTHGGRGIGGLMPADVSGRSPSWIGYVQVADAPAAIERARAAGATVHQEPMAIEGVGTVATLADPQGAMLSMIQVVPPPPGTPPNLPAGWHELHTTDREAALAFHLPLWGWDKGAAMDMGPAGIYQMLAHDGADFGAVVSMPGEAPHWLFYFEVDAIDPAVARVSEAGGTVTMGPHEVPTGQWIALCTDPDGAAFAMVTPR